MDFLASPRTAAAARAADVHVDPGRANHHAESGAENPAIAGRHATSDDIPDSARRRVSASVTGPVGVTPAAAASPAAARQAEQRRHGEREDFHTRDG